MLMAETLNKSDFEYKTYDGFGGGVLGGLVCPILLHKTCSFLAAYLQESG